MTIGFTAIDFETANHSNASACSVGVVKVVDGAIVDRASWLIKPPLGHDEFLPWNTRIHGITASDVERADSWADIVPRILDFAAGDVFVAHNAGFDRAVFHAVSDAERVDVGETNWLCSLRVARKTYHLDSYRLPVAALAAGFDDFTHHDAAHDAEACAHIIMHAALRHDAEDLAHLAAICSTRIEVARKVAELAREQERWWA